MRISDWSSDVCSSDLLVVEDDASCTVRLEPRSTRVIAAGKVLPGKASTVKLARWPSLICPTSASSTETSSFILERSSAITNKVGVRSEEHTSELQSLMRISYAVFCLKKKNR